MDKNNKKPIDDFIEERIQELSKEAVIGKSDGNKALIDFKTKELKQNADEKVAQLKTIIDGRIKQLEGKIPEKFDPKEIKDQIISETKKNNKSITGIKKQITKIQDSLDETKQLTTNADEAIKEKIANFKVHLKHKELEDIWPDDHHHELHIIESHPGLNATTQDINDLVSGGYADRLHTHKIPQVEILHGSSGGSKVSDLAYGVAWDGITDFAPSKNAVYDKIETITAGDLENIVEDLTPQLGGNLDGQAFTITTTNTISGGIVRTNNYQNLGGTESFIWSAGDDWWELSDDFHMVGVITGVASYNGLVVTANTGAITTGTWNGTDIAVAGGGTGLGAIADGSVLVTNAANVLSAITWHAAGTKILTNIDGTISWEAAGAGAATAWDDIGDPDADGTVAFAGFEQTLSSTLNEAAHTTLTIYNSTADLTAAVTLLKLTYNDDGDADGTYFECLDHGSADSKFKIAADGNTSVAGWLTVVDEVYGAGWDGSTQVPTKNAVYDKIQTLGGSTLFQHRWIANGPYQAGTLVDGGYISDSSFSITGVWIYRGTAGTASSTILDIHKNGVTMYTTQANRPTIAWDDGDSKVDCTLPDVVTISAGDIITMDIDQKETGTPKDLILIIQGS